MSIGERIKVAHGEIRVGQALPWPLYDGEGQLLLRQSYVIQTDSQLERLLDRGVYRPEPDGTKRRDSDAAANKPLTPFDKIGFLEVRLRSIFDDILAKKNGVAARVIEFCDDLQELCDEDSDAALGALHLDHHGSYTIFHPIHVALLCELLGRRLRIDLHQRLSLLAAAVTANVGMLELQEVLHNQTDPLTKAQREALNRHPVDGVAILIAAGVDDETWLEAVIQHHERPDGSGYPHGIRADAISTPARVLALADIYCAMITPRRYRSEILAKDALREMFLKRGEEVDGDLVQIFIKEMGIFPPGALVRLNNGEHAVVIKRSRDATCPRAQAVAGPRGAPYSVIRERDCSVDDYGIKEMIHRDKALQLNPAKLWGYD